MLYFLFTLCFALFVLVVFILPSTAFVRFGQGGLLLSLVLFTLYAIIKKHKTKKTDKEN